jgi:hypothetical protein
MHSTAKPLKAHLIPKPFATIVDRVNDRDRELFAANPGKPCYLRPYVPGEFPPASLAAMGVDLPSQDSWILVHNIALGVRSRQPIGHMVHGNPPDGGRITLAVLSEQSVIEGVPAVGWAER